MKFEVFKRIAWTAIKSCTIESIKEYENESLIESPAFQIELEGNITEWCMEIYPNGHSVNDIGQISLFLRRKDSIATKFNAKYKLIIGKSKESVLVTGTTSSEEFKDGSYGRQNSLSHEKLAEFESEYIEDNNLLIIICEIKLSSVSEVEVPGTTLSTEILKMFEDEQFTDFKLKCSDGEVLTCHKFILVARSPVIYQILSTEMKEDQHGLAEVPDFDSEVMKQVLRFIYCNNIENLDQLSCRLILAAEKYELEELKQMCIENMVENLTIENVIEPLIIFSRISGSETFFTECADFIMNNYIAITEGWEEIPNDVLKKLMDHIIERNKKTENI